MNQTDELDGGYDTALPHACTTAYGFVAFPSERHDHLPDYAAGDVGTTFYKIEYSDWQPWGNWNEEIAPNWRGQAQQDLREWFSGINFLWLREAQKQSFDLRQGGYSV